MLKQQARLVEMALRLADAAAFIVAFLAAYLVRDRVLDAGLPGLYPLGLYWPELATSIVLWFAAAWLARVYDTYRTYALGTELARLVRAAAAVALLEFAGAFLAKHDVSRVLMALFYSMAFTLMATSRVAIRVAARAARRRGRNTRTFAVAGSGDFAAAVAQRMLDHREWGLVLAGYVSEDGAGGRNGPVLGNLADLGFILEKHVIDLVVFAVSPARMEAVEAGVALCEQLGVRVKICLDLSPRRIARLSFEDLDGVPVLDLATTPTDALALAAKRAFDVAASVLALLLASPLMLAMAVGIKLDSPGPVLFRQARVGRYGRPFSLLKFRSMRCGAEGQLEALRHRNDVGEPAFKLRDDPRITRLGRLLRRTSLDEVPQFWNVLVGEMSVVGPRPPLPSEVERYQRWQRRRLSVRPGITCTWQVSGRSEVDFDRWVELDLQYIDTWSLWKDVEIVLRTIPAVIQGRGAR